MLALFAFVLAQVPASALASLCAPVKCEMPCCQGKESTEQKVHGHSGVQIAPSTDHCESDEMGHEEHAEKSSGSISSKTPDGCGCVIKSSSTPELPTVTLASSPNSAPTHLDAVLPPAPIILNVPVYQDVRPGIVGADSGPPISRSYCVWQGRAPPVFLV